MRFAQFFVVGLASYGLLICVNQAAAQNDVPTRPLNTMASMMERISKSKTPSEAVDAYAQAYAETGGDTMTERAFMVRMVDFGMPEMAEKQAEDLSIRTSDGMPLAVMAFASARADKLDQAILHIESAVRASPNDAFVARTAGQILAWYDVRKATANYPEAVQHAAEYVRERLENRHPFARAYAEVHEPIAALYSGGADGNGMVLANTDLTTLGAFSGSSQAGFSSPMALFYAAPFSLFPSYSYWYQPIGANMYYYQDWWHRGVGAGRLFPFPSIDRDTRFMKLPTGGFALVSAEGTSLYQPLNSGPIWSPGFYGGFGNYYGNYYGDNFNAGFIGGGGFIYQGPRNFGFAGRGFNGPRAGVAGPRLTQRTNSLPPNLSSRNDFRVGIAPFPSPSDNAARRLGGR